MKKTILCILILSNMLIISGCNDGNEKEGDNSTPNVEEPSAADNSVPKENVVYGGTINAVSSYYLINGKDKMSYFYENKTWFGLIENQNGETRFSFSNDLKQLTLSNEKQDTKVEINQIDENNILQSFYKYSGEKIASFLYYKEAQKIYLVEVNDLGQRDETTRQDITAQYTNALTKMNNVTPTSLLTTAKKNIQNLPVYAKQSLNELMMTRSFSNSKTSQCSTNSTLNSIWEGDFNQLAKQLLTQQGFNVMAIVQLVGVGEGCLLLVKSPLLCGVVVAGWASILAMKNAEAKTIPENTQANQILTKNLDNLRPKAENVLQKPMTLTTKVDSYVSKVQNYGTNLVEYWRTTEADGIKRWGPGKPILCDSYDIGFNLDFMTTWKFDPSKKAVSVYSYFDGESGSGFSKVGYFNPLTGYFKVSEQEEDDTYESDGYTWSESGTLVTMEGYLTKDNKINLTWIHEVTMERVSGRSTNPDHRIDGSWRSCGANFDWKLSYQ